LQVAEQLFPGHAVLQLATPLRTSSLQAQLLQASNSSAGVLVVLGPAAAAAGRGRGRAGGSLTVDVPLKPRRGLSLVLATPAALAAAAERAAGSAEAADGSAAGLAELQLPRSLLLPVRCGKSRSGTFIEAR
jgi:hypothetical protein